MINLHGGITSKELRDHSHPFGGKLLEMKQTCDLVCSSPLVAIVAGEHTGVDGGYMLVIPLTLKVYVGIIGRNLLKSDSMSPVLSSFTYYDHFNNIVNDMSHNPQYIGYKENIRNIGPLLEDIAKDYQFKWLPSEVIVLSEASPGRGANWSGAFASAMALALYLLQGKNELPQQLDPQVWNIDDINHRDTDVDLLFRMALKIECMSHGLASGYGPACSLLPGLKKWILFKGYIHPNYANKTGDPKRNQGYSFAHWDAYQRLLPAKWIAPEDLYDIMMIDSGCDKSTNEQIRQLRGVAEDGIAHDLNSLLVNDPNMPEDYLLRSSQWPDRILNDHRIALTTLGALSILAIKTLRDCCSGTEANPRSLIRTLQSIDHVQRRLGLDFSVLDQLRQDLKDLIREHQVAVKISGGGGGGNIILFGTKDGVSSVPIGVDSSSPCPTVLWRLSRDGVAVNGTECYSKRVNLPLDTRLGTPPFPRPPQLHQAVVIDWQGNAKLVPDQPGTIFEVYKILREISITKASVYMYFHDKGPRDGQEPIYFVYPNRAVDPPMLIAEPLKPKEGFPALKGVLWALARSRQVSVINPTTCAGNYPLQHEELNRARDEFNGFGYHIKTPTNLVFPKLSVSKIRTQDGAFGHIGDRHNVEVKLVMTQDTNVFVIYAAAVGKILPIDKV